MHLSHNFWSRIFKVINRSLNKGGGNGKYPYLNELPNDIFI